MVNLKIQKEKLTITPLHVNLTITNSCNLNCLHCFADCKLLNNYVSLKNIKKILLNLKNNNILFVDLSGGEPTTHPNFIEIINYLDYIKLPYYITTNGVFSSKIRNVILNSKYIMGLKISLDGILYKSFNFIRNTNKTSSKLFNLCLLNIKKLAQNLDVTICTVLHSRNYQELVFFPKKLKKLKITKWSISPLLYKGRGLINRNLIEIDFKKINFKKIKTESKKNGVIVSLTDFDRYLDKKNFVFECGAGINFLNIDIDKKIAVPCVLLKYTKFKDFIYKFNFNSFDIYKIWHSKEFKLWRRQQVNGCSKCKLKDKCWRCPIQNDVLNLNILDEINICYKSD
jgi:MoaA/NifB/PqqE/SkfB family radical SAM enzyme